LTLAAAPDLAAREAPDRIALHGHGLETAHPRTRLIDCWIDWRNRLLSDPRFQRWAADFPLTRPIARSRAKGLFDLVAGFVYSQTLAACVRLDLFPILGGGPMSVGALAERLDLPVEATARLLGAAASLRLVEPAGRDGADPVTSVRYALGVQGAALLGNAGLLEMIAHHDLLYADLADSVGLLRRGAGSLATFWPYAVSATPAEKTAAEVQAYSELMAASLPTIAADVFKAYPIRRHRRLMDVGGGEGAFLTAAAAHAPKLELRLFDLPAVAARARARLARHGLEARAEVLEGDFLSEPLPSGADLITLIRILHDHDDAGVLALLRRVRAALPQEGAVLVAEPMSDARGGDRVADAYFAFYLKAMGRGRARTPEELGALLETAGFTRRRQLRTRSPFLLRAIVARP
jgi:demethylspheroidene O-methyltransferase